MGQPHKCPACEDKTDEEAKACRACGGTRVVWEPEEAGASDDDRLAIDGL
jgi:RNA polymerase subunit RPABC4/transcription elongation factor Spt4